MYVVKLIAENVKRLKAVEIKPEGPMVVISGRNDQGKTSVLDSIEMALGGTKSIPSMPIRKGAEKARIVVDLGDLVVKRVFTAKESRLEVTNKEGAVYKSPQSILDNLVGRLSFDPLEFARMNDATAEGRRKQADVVRKLIGLDFSQLDSLKDTLYRERANLNRDLKAAQIKSASVPEVEAPDEEIRVSDLLKELEKKREVNQDNEYTRSLLEDQKTENRETLKKIEALKEDIVKIEREAKAKVNKIKKEIEAHEKDLNDGNDRVETLQKEIADLVDEDLSEIKTKIETAEATNTNVRQKLNRATLAKEVTAIQAKVDSLTKEIENIEAEKAKQLAEAKMPISGLSFDDNGVLYGGIPFDQCSTTVKLKVSTAVGLAMNPKLKILLIREGSFLDEDNLKLLEQMVIENDAQAWIEVVSKDMKNAVVIEDGMVKENG